MPDVFFFRCKKFQARVFLGGLKCEALLPPPPPMMYTESTPLGAEQALSLPMVRRK